MLLLIYLVGNRRRKIEALEDLIEIETEEDVRKYLDRNNISIVGIKSEDIGSLFEIIKHCRVANKKVAG